MYEAHFQLRERPFTTNPLVEHYFPAEAIEQARQTLARIIERAEGPALVIGPPGTGKSMLAHVLAAQFRNHFAVALLNNGRFRTSRELLQAILFELGLSYRKLEEGEMRLALVAHVTRNERCPNGLLLLVDEAHALSLRVLEELRLVTNIVRGGEARVRLVLFGGPGLEERFAHPKLESFGQRLAARAYLRPWNHAETTQFILGQIDDAGGQSETLFRPEAIDAVYRASEGVPRLAIQLCDHALALAFAGGRTAIGAAGIEEAWADLQQLPAPWNESARGTSAAGVEEAGATVIEFGRLDDEPLEAPPTVRPALRAHVPDDRQMGDIDSDLDVIDSRMLELDDEVEAVQEAPRAAVRLEPIPPTHAETFAEEELLVDHYGVLDARLARLKVRPTQPQALQLADMIAALCNAQPVASREVPSAKPAQATAATNPEVEAFAVPAFEPVTTAGGSDPVYPESASITTLATAFSRPRDVHGPRAAASATAGDDADLLVIEDAEQAPLAATGTARAHATGGAWRQDYRQLFSRLRRG